MTTPAKADLVDKATHAANLQERERNTERLLAGLRESNKALAAEVHKLRSDIEGDETVRLVNSANEELSKYVGKLEKELSSLSTLLLAKDAELGKVAAERDQLRADANVKEFELYSVLKLTGHHTWTEMVTRARDLDFMLTKALADNEGWKKRCHEELEPERERLRTKLASLESARDEPQRELECTRSTLHTTDEQATRFVVERNAARDEAKRLRDAISSSASNIDVIRRGMNPNEDGTRWALAEVADSLRSLLDPPSPPAQVGPCLAVGGEGEP